MNVVFIGGKNIGYGVLSYLLSTDSIKAVYSNPSDLETDKWYKSVSKLASKNNIPYKVVDINKDLNYLKSLKIDWIVCAYYDLILSDSVLKIPKLGSVNVHLGLIDEYRGCYPTTFPIIDNKKIAGITIHKLTSVVDGGSVYTTNKIDIDSSDTGLTLYNKLTDLALNSFRLNWNKIKNGKIKLSKPLKLGIYHKRANFPSHKINSKWSKDEKDRYIRALTFPPFPRPYFESDGKKSEVVYEKSK